MQSIFNLKTSTDELESSNYGVTKDLFEQVTASRDVTYNNFPNGQISLKWGVSGTKWWVPSRSYLRFRVRLTKAAVGSALSVFDTDIAPIMNQCSALFTSAEFRMNDKTISRISDYLPQIDTLQTRMNKSKSWIDSVGNSTNWWQENFQIRQENVCYDGVIENGTDFEESRVALGYDENNTVAFDAATGVLTFAAGTGPPPPNNASLYQIGDIILLDVAAGGLYDLRVVEITDGLNLKVQGGVVDQPAEPRSFFRKRNSEVARNVTEYEITWTPPLSIFQVEHAIPSSRCELILNPQTSSIYKKAAVESRDQNRIDGTDFDFAITSMFLYVNTVEGSRVDNLTYYLDLTQTACQAEGNLSTTFASKTFDVSPSTKALAVAFQDVRVGTNTMYSSTKFRAYNALPRADVCQDLTRFFINYAGVNKPQVDADPLYRLAGSGIGSDYGFDFTTQRYVETLINSGSYHDTGGSETIDDWQNRGSYYLFSYNKDGNDRSTRVSVHTAFKSNPSPTILTNARMLLFSMSSQVAKIVISNGNVIDVQVEDV